MGATTFRSRSFAALLLSAAVVIALDHVTKVLVVDHLALNAEWPAGAFVAIHRTQNSGAAFSMLPNAQWLFLAVAVVVCGYILIAGHRFGATVYRQTVLGAVLGGAVSNAIDRIAHGYVVDFIDFRHFPVFNVADIAITCGIMLAVVTIQNADAIDAAVSDDAVQRLDVWLAAERGITRHAAVVMIAAGLVTVNGRTGRSGQKVKPGDLVETDDRVVAAEAPVVAENEPRVELTVVYEDEWLAVIDKPPGMVVHPAPGHRDGTLADGLRQRGTTWSLLGGEQRPGIVHRLDRDTSGLIVVARTEAAHRNLAAQLQARTLGRTYWALVHGPVREETGRIEAPIGRDPRDRKRMAVVDGGRPAFTDFRVTARHPAHTELEVTLETGRTHQIRVHLAYITKPIVGDPVYGRREDRNRHGVGRPALHARELRLIHPEDGHEMSFRSELPEDLLEIQRSVTDADED